jgi:hypothetical protein
MSEADKHPVRSSRWLLGARAQLCRLLCSACLVFFPAALIVAYMVRDRAQPAVA